MPQNQESEPVFLDQTKKYVTSLDEREYRVTDQPGEVPLFKRYVGERAYQEMLSAGVVECVDMLIYNPKIESFLLGTRQQEPQQGDWVIGGRMRAGESVADAASRNMKRELGIDIDRGKLKTAGHYKFVWDSREQPPLAVMDDEDNPTKIIGYAKGCHMASTLELYPLSGAELEAMSHNEEYSLMRWVKAEDILEAPEGQYHPCLHDMVRDGLDVLTTPEAPASDDEKRLRLYGQIATAEAQLRQLDGNNH